MTSTKYNLSRRDFLRNASTLTAGLMIAPRMVFQQQSPVDIIINEASTSPVTVEVLRNNISLLLGSGGNIGVFTGADGKLLIDAGIDVSQKKITNALTGLSPEPIKCLVNTHWHFDHTSGNEWLHKEGATIVAHTNTKNNLSREIRVREWNHTFPAAPAGALPTRVFKDKHTMDFNGISIKMQHMPNAHTDSDISLHFENADVLFVGDVWWNGYYPFIDADTKGNINGVIAAVNANLKKATAETIIIPGHGPRGNKKELEAYGEMLNTITDKIKTLKNRGNTISEVVAAKPTKVYDEKYGNLIVNGDWFARLVYNGV